MQIESKMKMDIDNKNWKHGNWKDEIGLGKLFQRCQQEFLNVLT